MRPSLPHLLLLLLVLCAPIAASADAVLVPPGESVAGVPQADWSRAWWQWARSFTSSDSPVADRSGALCASRQQGNVWFLAGTYGTRRTVRTCVVPRGKHLFFPLINYMVWPAEGSHPSCMGVMRQAAEMTDEVSGLILEVDGVRQADLAAHRQATRSCFDAGARAEPPVRVFPSAANGYYVMLRPLPPGEHRIEFGGVLPDMVQAVTYTVIVR